jgi:hypothetical protein
MIGSVHKPAEAVEVFISYSHKDEKLRREMEVHLSLLKREGLVSAWHDRQIGAGQDFNEEIRKRISTAHIILVLVSPDSVQNTYVVYLSMNVHLPKLASGPSGPRNAMKDKSLSTLDVLDWVRVFRFGT